MFKHWWTQVGKNASLKDVKKRVTDHINAAGMQITLDDTRLWLYTTLGDRDTQIKDKCEEVVKQMNSGVTLEQEPDIEVNSGVEFPGQCMEPLMKSALRIN